MELLREKIREGKITFFGEKDTKKVNICNYCK